MFPCGSLQVLMGTEMVDEMDPSASPHYYPHTHQPTQPPTHPSIHPPTVPPAHPSTYPASQPASHPATPPPTSSPIHLPLRRPPIHLLIQNSLSSLHWSYCPLVPGGPHVPTASGADRHKNRCFEKHQGCRCCLPMELSSQTCALHRPAPSPRGVRPRPSQPTLPLPRPWPLRVPEATP